MKSAQQSLVRRIVHDLNDRAGMGFDHVDEDIQREIFDLWDGWVADEIERERERTYREIMDVIRDVTTEAAHEAYRATRGTETWSAIVAVRVRLENKLATFLEDTEERRRLP